MKRKKTRAAVLTGMMMSAIFVFPAFAHGHGHHRQTAAVYSGYESCPVCTLENCTETGRHIHDGISYCGYAHSSGYCDGSCEIAVHSGCGHHCQQ